MNLKDKITIIFIVFCFTKYLFPLSIGSDTSVSRENYTEFTQYDTDNRIAGFASMENGFGFETDTLSCIFDSIFPVNKAFHLNGSTLILNLSITFGNKAVFISPGTIEGKRNQITFPPKNQLLLPNEGKRSSSPTITYITYIPTNIEWCHNSKYLAIDDQDTSRIYILGYINQTIVNITNVTTPVSTIATHQWQPQNYFLAVGGTNGIVIYQYDTATATLTQITYDSTITYVTSLAWSPDGKYIACTRKAANELNIYYFDGSKLTFITGIDIPPSTTNRNAKSNTLSWRSDGKYIVSGYTQDASYSYDIFVHKFDGTNLTQNAVGNIGGVSSLDWNPTDSLIVVTGINTIKIFKHDANAGTLTEIPTAQINESYSLLNVKWKPSGRTFTYSYDNQIDPLDHNAKNYIYDSDTEISLYIDGIGMDLNAINVVMSWAPNNKYLALATGGMALYVYEYPNYPFIIKDTKLHFNGDFTITASILFQGECQITGNGTNLSFIDNGQIVVDSNSKLYLKDLTVTNLSAQKIRNYDNSGQIIFNNVNLILSDNYSFTVGSFEVNNELHLEGSYTFIYAASKTSTIKSFATLYLEDNITFSYDPSVADSNLIYLENNQSSLVLNKATLATTAMDMLLTKGNLFIKNKNYISTSGGKVIIGNDNSELDLYCELAPEASLNIKHGKISIRNTNINNFKLSSILSSLVFYTGTELELTQNIDIEDGFITLYKDANLINNGNYILGSVNMLDNYKYS